MSGLKQIKVSYEGKVVFLNFWSTSCLPSVSDMNSSLDLVKTDFRNDDVQFIFVCTGKDKAACEQTIKDPRADVVHMYTEDAATIMSRFNSISMPYQVILNREGEVIRKGSEYKLRNSSTKKVLRKLQEKMKH